MNAPARPPVIGRLRDDLDAYLSLRARWADDPARYVVERIGVNPTAQQRQILDAIAPEGAKVSVRSGHNTGKSSSTSWAIMWHLETRDYSRIPCTAPTASQLRDVLWAELALWIRRADETSKARGDHPRLWFSSLFRLTQDRLTDRGAEKEWFAVARTSGKSNPDALQGFHAGDVSIGNMGERELSVDANPGRLMFVVDEAPGVDDKVFEIAEGALASPGARLLMLGNPVRTTGYFARSQIKDRGHFTTLHLRTQDSPLAEPDYRARLVRRWGEASNIVRVRADGEFPLQDDQALISLEQAEACLTRDPYSENAEVRLGIDPARYGSDRTVMIGRRGRNLLCGHIATKQGTMQTAGEAILTRKKIGAARIFVDSIGIGAGVVDRLVEQSEPVTDVDVGRAAPSRKRTGHDIQGASLRDYLYLEIAEWINTEEPSFALLDKQMAEDLVGELCSIHYRIDSSGRMVIEDKDAMRKRLGHSPDIAEALAMTFAPVRSESAAAVAGRTSF